MKTSVVLFTHSTYYYVYCFKYDMCVGLYHMLQVQISTVNRTLSCGCNHNDEPSVHCIISHYGPTFLLSGDRYILGCMWPTALVNIIPGHITILQFVRKKRHACRFSHEKCENTCHSANVTWSHFSMNPRYELSICTII